MQVGGLAGWHSPRLAAPCLATDVQPPMKGIAHTAPAVPAVRGVPHAVPVVHHAVPAVPHALQAMVCAMLEDAKLEVREMAAATLSGKQVDQKLNTNIKKIQIITNNYRAGRQHQPLVVDTGQAELRTGLMPCCTLPARPPARPPARRWWHPAPTATWLPSLSPPPAPRAPSCRRADQGPACGRGRCPAPPLHPARPAALPLLQAPPHRGSSTR